MALPQELRYTLADVLAGDEEERIELIDGYPTMLSSPNRAHQKAIMELSAHLYGFLKGKKCEVYPAPFGVRPLEGKDDRPEDVDTVVEPDITVVCDPDKLDDIGCKGAPDLIMEVLSPSNQRHDRVTKFNLYQRAGVREYWMVDPNQKSVQTFVLEDGRYVANNFGEAGDQLPVHILEGCTIDLAEVFLE